MASTPPLLIGYARVSTSDQDLRLQIEALTAAGVKPARIYQEKASGARGTHRPALAAAMKSLRSGDALVVWKLDRLGRSLDELIDTVRRLEAKGANLRVLTMQIDTATPGGRFIFHIFGALAEFERELIVERTNAGLMAARAQGRIGGRQRIPAETEAEAIKLLRQGLDPREVSKRIGISKSTIYTRMRTEWAAALAEGTAT
jgi:DNA invertase Pin-like site-specific DNA recombinase